MPVLVRRGMGGEGVGGWVGPRVGGPILPFDRFSADVHFLGDRKRRNSCPYGACAVGASDVDIGLGCCVSCSNRAEAEAADYRIGASAEFVLSILCEHWQ